MDGTDIHVHTMIIALDFDNTWTADKELWNWFYTAASKKGHIVIMATMRSRHSEDMDRYDLPPDMPIVYCGMEYKQHACLDAGFEVDVWVDDMPMLISPGLIIGSDEEL